MTGEDVFGVIIMPLCSWGCAALFFGIGVAAVRQQKPMHFWAGIPMDPKTISDIPAYNRANSRMWKQYSIPFWLCGVLAIASIWDSRLMIACVILLVVASIGGAVWLLLKYQKICKQYIYKK